MIVAVHGAQAGRLGHQRKRSSGDLPPGGGHYIAQTTGVGCLGRGGPGVTTPPPPPRNRDWPDLDLPYPPPPG